VFVEVEVVEEGLALVLGVLHLLVGIVRLTIVALDLEGVTSLLLSSDLLLEGAE
jgi:hypothetical protein